MMQVTKGKTRGKYLLVRTRIVGNSGERDVGEQQIGERDLAVTLHHDENAAPQNIIRITAQSAQQLRERLNGEKLRHIVDEVELKHLADIISGNPSKQNREMQDEIKKMFGIDMKIPAAVNANKKAKDFIWMSNNASSVSDTHIRAHDTGTALVFLRLLERKKKTTQRRKSTRASER